MFEVWSRGEKIPSEVLPEDITFLQNLGYSVSTQDYSGGTCIVASKENKRFALMKFKSYLLDYSSINHHNDPIEGFNLADLIKKFEKFSS